VLFPLIVDIFDYRTNNQKCQLNGVRVLMGKSARVKRGKSIFLLIDCNNFFVSCERVFQPSLRTRPVIVLSRNDGCVISRSNEAKALGIKMGVPYFKVKDLCHRHQVSVHSCNFGLYGDMSRRVMSVLKELWRNVEVYSVDEAFLEAEDDICEVLGHSLKETLMEWVGIPVSVGIAHTKTLSKVAADIAKTDPAHGGVFTLKPGDACDDILRHLDVGDIWGIGWKLSQHLPALGIKTAYDLKCASPHLIRRRFSIMVERIVYELNGMACLELDERVSDQKSRIYTRSFAKRVTELSVAEEIISTFASRLSEQLREAKQVAGGLIVLIRTSAHVPKQHFYRGSHYEGFGDATSDTRALVTAAVNALRRCFVQGVPYQKLGIILTDLQSKNTLTEPLFGRTQRRRSDMLMSALDCINRVYGDDMVRVASSGTNRGWNTPSGFKSAGFTLDWEGILRV
jgi:DNA polymerase V